MPRFHSRLLFAASVFAGLAAIVLTLGACARSSDPSPPPSPTRGEGVRGDSTSASDSSPLAGEVREGGAPTPADPSPSIPAPSPLVGEGGGEGSLDSPHAAPSFAPTDATALEVA